METMLYDNFFRGPRSKEVRGKKAHQTMPRLQVLIFRKSQEVSSSRLEKFIILFTYTIKAKLQLKLSSAKVNC